VTAPRIPIETVAQKLGAHGHPESLRDFDYTGELLVSLGITPDRFDVEMLPVIQARAVGIAQRRVAAEIKTKQAETMLAVAFGVIIAVLIHTLPAEASGGPLRPDIGLIILFPLVALAVGYAIVKHLQREHPSDDAHDDAYGDVPAQPYGRPE
jgi:hypothetical protein